MSTTDNMDTEKAVVEKAAPLENEDIPVTSPGSKHKKRTLLVVIVIASALAIGLGVGLSNKNKQNSQTASPSESTTITLERLCEQDVTACKGVCDAVMCCFDVDDTTNECFISESECLEYEPCLVFVENESTTEQDTNNGGGGNSLPGANTANDGSLNPPTIEVETICNSGYMEVSNITCEEACWEANCCYWTGEEACYDENAATCDLWKAAGCFVFSDPFGEATENEEQEGGYSIPGGVALEEGEILQEPDEAVYDACDSVAPTDITCEEACNKAACCYWAGEDSCYDDFAVTCDLWKEAGCFEFSVQHEQEVP